MMLDTTNIRKYTFIFFQFAAKFVDAWKRRVRVNFLETVWIYIKTLEKMPKIRIRRVENLFFQKITLIMEKHITLTFLKNL